MAFIELEGIIIKVTLYFLGVCTTVLRAVNDENIDSGGILIPDN